MLSEGAPEHFVTLFDNNFLPMGLCLHQSLMAHAQPFHLWVLCMDESVHKHLALLNLVHVSLIALSDVETDGLLTVKPNRTRGEYCWTLTPFAPQFVFDRDGAVQRITYLDADLFFFGAPSVLLKEFEFSGKHVLITEHAYAPEYDQSSTSGRFCVQFMTFRRTSSAMKVMAWWQARCLEWCYARIEDGKFGDQKYLDDWPERFSAEVHVLQQIEQTLAPWNLRRFTIAHQQSQFVFYHFHSLRIVQPNQVVLYAGYRLHGFGEYIYECYLAALKQSVNLMSAYGISVPTLPVKSGLLNSIRYVKSRLLGNARIEKF